MISESSQRKHQPQTIRVLTFNILSPDQANWEGRRQAARTGLRALQPDVLALQETTPGHAQDQLTDLLGPEYHLVENPARSGDMVGGALVSRWPFVHVREVDLSVAPRVPSAAAVVAELELPRPFGLTVVVHHGAAYQFGYARERELQAVACAHFVEDYVAGRNVHVVLLGDFNDTPDSSSVRFWTGRQSLEGLSVAYQDAWEAKRSADAGHTFSPSNPLVRAGQMPLEVGRRIDYIMIRSGIHGPTLAIADCQRVLDDTVAGVWASDHFGVMADLQVPTHPPGTWQYTSSADASASPVRTNSRLAQS
jgi:endonuclease/exonuclease/phosphatase family metal-dependent hydrolase